MLLKIVLKHKYITPFDFAQGDYQAVCSRIT